jgi:hypothetical protein
MNWSNWAGGLLRAEDRKMISERCVDTERQNMEANMRERKKLGGRVVYRNKHE